MRIGIKGVTRLRRELIKGSMPAVIVVKPLSTAKADLEVMAKQVANITTKCCRNNVEIQDIIITLSGIKDIKKRVKSLAEHREIEYLMVYSAKGIATNEKEFKEFVSDMQTWYGIEVKTIR